MNLAEKKNADISRNIAILVALCSEEQFED